MKRLRAWKVLTLAAVAAAVGLAGCQTTNPYTGEQQTSKAAKGAGIGAAAGAVVGLITGDDSKERKERALIGAGVGALAGGSVGYYMDVQEQKLRQQLQALLNQASEERLFGDDGEQQIDCEKRRCGPR